MAAAALEYRFIGQGRCRKKKAPKTNLPSHYQYAYWAYDDGKRYAVPVGGVKSDKRPEFPLISTALKNEGTGTETLIWLHFDLDFKRADKKWVKDGKLNWPAISQKLLISAPELVKYFTGVAESSGGKGLSLMLAISPLELIDENADVQKLAYIVQADIIRLLNVYKMGADEGARGLKRLMPNIFQTERVIDRDEVTESIIQKKRPRVLQNLLFYLRFHPDLRNKKKKDRDDILWADIRVELPCARLYTDLLDTAGPWGTEQRSVQEIITRYGMSKNTVYKLLADPPKWLGVEHIRGEGYRLTIRPSKEMTDRAYMLIEEGGEGKARGTFPVFNTATIQRPESVLDGERNQWLVSVVLACKWKGIDRAIILSALKRLVRLVPGYQASRSLTRELEAIVRSLYHHRSSRRSCNPELVLPEWLCEALLPSKPKKLSQTFCKKGTSVAGSQADVSAQPVTPQPSLEVQLPTSPFSSLTPLGVTPGVRGGPAPCSGGYTDQLEMQTNARTTAPCVLDFDPDAARLEPDPPKINPAGRAAAPKTAPSGCDVGGGNTFAHLSGSALSGAFSKGLMRSSLSAGEKVRILTEVTSETDPHVKERLRREWLGKLS